MVKIAKLAGELSRVPFAIWAFVLVYLMFRLMALAQEVDERRDGFKERITTLCGKVEESANLVLNLHKEVALEAIDAAADLANYASKVAVESLLKLIGLADELLLQLIKMKTNIVRCTVVGGLDMGSTYFLNNSKELENFANGAINGSVSTIEGSLNVIRGILNKAASAVQAHIDQYNLVAAQIQANHIDLPRLNVQIPFIDPISFDRISFPNTTGWQAPDWQALEDQLFGLIDPMTYLKDQIALIPRTNISAAEIMQRLNATEALKLSQLEFCADLNWTTFDREVDHVVYSLHVAVGMVGFFIFLLLCLEVAVVLWKHEKGDFWRPTWFRHDGPLDVFLRHVWHKPSITCIFVGLLGISILQLLMAGAEASKESFEAQVIAPIEDYTLTQVGRMVSKLDALSSQFAGMINAEVIVVERALFSARDDINSTLQSITHLQEDADADIMDAVGSVDFAGPTLVEGLQCLTSFLMAPVEGVMNMVPFKDGLPRVSEKILSFNATRVESLVSETLRKSLYPYDWYHQCLSREVIFYYLLTAYGSPVFLVGIAFGIHALFKQRKS